MDVRTILGIDEVATAALEKTEAELLTISSETTGPKAADELRAHQAHGRDELAVSWDRLEWAFAGTAENAGSVSGGGTRRVWKHWVDSRKKDATGATDEGIMTPYQGEGGDGEELELETGRMVNPATGQEQDYEELWAEVPNEPAGNPSSKLCVVMVAQHSKSGTPTGLVIRLGRYCQGVLRVGDKFVVERWLWSVQAGTWKRVVRIGDGEIPCSLCCNEGGKLSVGNEFKPAEGGFHWRVEEVHAN